MRQQIAVSFVVGLIFALGLGLSGMTQPQNIIAFLDLQNWNPTLLFVMVGAILVFGVAFRLIVRRPAPILTSQFEISTNRVITWQLVVGAFVFGVGWGIGGFCGGPALASLALGSPEVLVFIATMFLGMFLSKRFTNS